MEGASLGTNAGGGWGVRLEAAGLFSGIDYSGVRDSA